MTKIIDPESSQMPGQDPKHTDDSGEEAEQLSDIDRQIAENLRKLYQSTVEEELPPKLQDLLDRLQSQEPGNE
jgi:hypothetical protein